MAKTPLPDWVQRPVKGRIEMTRPKRRRTCTICRQPIEKGETFMLITMDLIYMNICLICAAEIKKTLKISKKELELINAKRVVEAL